MAIYSDSCCWFAIKVNVQTGILEIVGEYDKEIPQS